jgi:hypothetical protein
MRKRQIMLPGVTICFLSAPDYGLSHILPGNLVAIIFNSFSSMDEDPLDKIKPLYEVGIYIDTSISMYTTSIV